MPSLSTDNDVMAVWIDCDPGHDDAIGLILAAHHPSCELLGVSTVAGNQDLEKVSANACAVLHAAGKTDIKVHKGQSAPLLRTAIHAEYAHGQTGLDLADGRGETVTDENDTPAADLTKTHHSNRKLQLITFGSLTNIALLVTLFPELIPHFQIRCMGGSIGPGNITPTAEFNIFADPESAKIVFESGTDLTIIPLEVTHTARATEDVLDTLCGDKNASRFRLYVRRILQFSAQVYRNKFGFDSPPVHDPCALFYALEPHHFDVKKMRVDVDTSSSLSVGQTVFDVWNRSDKRHNCTVAQKMNVEQFWLSVMDAIAAADLVSPMNVSMEKNRL